MKCAIFISFLAYGQLYIEPINQDMMCYLDTAIFKGMESPDFFAFQQCKYLDSNKMPIQVDTELVLDYVSEKRSDLCWRDLEVLDVLGD